MKNRYVNVIPTNEKNKFDPIYLVYLTWDGHDEDWIPRIVSFSKEYFESNKCLQLVLSYLSKGYQGKLFGDNWNDSIYGHHVTETKINNLVRFIVREKLEAYSNYIMCHSVSSITIIYVDEHRVVHDVKLEDFDSLYSTKEEAIKELENELEKYFTR